MILEAVVVLDSLTPAFIVLILVQSLSGCAFLDGYIGRRRDRHDIIVEILETARGGAIKTHIMYKAKLSYSQLEEYTTLLVEKGFLQKHAIFNHERKHGIFETTEQGERFLRNYRTLEL